jgi:hypothetical protein
VCVSFNINLDLFNALSHGLFDLIENKIPIIMWSSENKSNSNILSFGLTNWHSSLKNLFASNLMYGYLQMRFFVNQKFRHVF